MVGFYELLVILGVFILIVPVPAGLGAFWIWMLVDCMRNEPEEGGERTRWMIILLLASFPGAIVYFFVRRGKRVKDQSR
ncbi:MAG: PLDc N-terminal domain-containing protein [Pseudomonadota bacterium]